MSYKHLHRGILLGAALLGAPLLLFAGSPGTTLLNPELKFSGAGDAPDSWQAYPPAAGETQKMAPDPAGGMKFTDQDTTRGLGIGQWLSVTPGATYSAKLNVSGEGSLMVMLVFTPSVPARAAEVNQIKISAPTGSFSSAKQDPMIATVPPGAKFMRVLLYSSKIGKCDLSVKSIELKLAAPGTVDPNAQAPQPAIAAPATAPAAVAPTPNPKSSGALALDCKGNPAMKVLHNAPEILPKSTVYTIDFETGDYSQVHMIEGGNKAIVRAPDPVRNGKYAMKVMMTHDQHRTEVTGPRSEAFGEYKYGWSLFLPESFDATTFFSIVTQWHTWGSGKTYYRDGGPPTSVSIANNHWNLKIQHQDGDQAKATKEYFTFGNIPEDKGKWTDFYMEVNWQSPKTGGGYLRLFKNGVKVVDYTGPTWFDNMDKGPFFKMGIYKGGASWKGEESGAILYCDEFRMGDKSATRQQIDPAMQPKR